MIKMEINTDNYDSACRFCATGISGDRTYIFSRDNDEIFEKINSCLPITVKKTDPLPKQICERCFEALNQYIKFFNQVIEAEEKLKSFRCQTQIIRKNEGPCINCPLCSEGNMSLKDGRVILGPTRENCKDGQKPLSHIDDECLTQMIWQELEVVQIEPDDSDIAFEEDATYLCYNCKKCFTTEEEVSSHVCGDESDNDIDAEEETDLKVNGGLNYKGPAQCDICKREYKTIKSLKDHVAFCHPKSFHQCGFCNMKFSKKWLLTTHMRKHTGEKPYRCEKCGKDFPSSSYLWNHNNSHHTQRKLQCEVCNATGFYSKQDLENHVRTKHTKERIFHCKECDKSFMSSSVFYQHRYIHTDIRKYKCDHCKKSFRRWQTLHNHIRIHTGERPFPCDVCGRAFRQKGDMNKHKMSQHTVEFKPK